MFLLKNTPFSFLLLIFLGSSALCQAQNTISVTGKVLSIEQGKALEYVSVKLFKATDSSFQKGVFSGTDGRFSISINPGSYYLQLSLA